MATQYWTPREWLQRRVDNDGYSNQTRSQAQALLNVVGDDWGVDKRFINQDRYSSPGVTRKTDGFLGLDQKIMGITRMAILHIKLTTSFYQKCKRCMKLIITFGKMTQMCKNPLNDSPNLSALTPLMTLEQNKPVIAQKTLPSSMRICV